MTGEFNRLALHMNDLLRKNLKKTITTSSLALTKLPLYPKISLYLISPDYPKGRLPDEEMHAIMSRPAYWAFCWASGQILAAHLVAHPEICRNKTVLDLGAGSGVVTIAAAISGAASVIACDLDKHALDALVADSRIHDESVFKGFEKIGDISATTIPDLDELKEFGDVTIYYRKYHQVI